MLGKLKYLIVLAAVMCGLGVAGASPVLAGTCQAGAGTTTAAGDKVAFSAWITNCSGVDRVQFSIDGTNGTAGGGPGGSDDVVGYWWDASIGQAKLATLIIGNIQQAQCVGCQMSVVSYQRTHWCAVVGITHWMTTTYGFRVRSVDIHGVQTWGPWHRSITPGYEGYC